MATIPIKPGTREKRCERCGRFACFWTQTPRGKWLLVEVNTVANPACAVPTADRWGQGIPHAANCRREDAPWRARPAHPITPRNAR